jgi:hypothetical protein
MYLLDFKYSIFTINGDSKLACFTKERYEHKIIDTKYELKNKDKLLLDKINLYSPNNYDFEYPQHQNFIKNIKI